MRIPHRTASRFLRSSFAVALLGLQAIPSPAAGANGAIGLQEALLRAKPAVALIVIEVAAEVDRKSTRLNSSHRL